MASSTSASAEGWAGPGEANSTWAGPSSSLTVHETARSRPGGYLPRRASSSADRSSGGPTRNSVSRATPPAPGGRTRRRARRAWRRPWRRSAAASAGRTARPGRATPRRRSGRRASGRASWPWRSPRACPVNRPGPSPTATPPTGVHGRARTSPGGARSASATISWPARSIAHAPSTRACPARCPAPRSTAASRSRSRRPACLRRPPGRRRRRDPVGGARAAPSAPCHGRPRRRRVHGPAGSRPRRPARATPSHDSGSRPWIDVPHSTNDHRAPSSNSSKPRSRTSWIAVEAVDVHVHDVDPPVVLANQRERRRHDRRRSRPARPRRPGRTRSCPRRGRRTAPRRRPGAAPPSTAAPETRACPRRSPSPAGREVSTVAQNSPSCSSAGCGRRLGQDRPGSTAKSERSAWNCALDSPPPCRIAAGWNVGRTVRPPISKRCPRTRLIEAGRSRMNRVAKLPERDDHARVDGADLALQVRLAGVDLVGQRVAVARRPALHDVRDVDVLARRPISPSIFVSSWPAAPTNGSPCLSSW